MMTFGELDAHIADLLGMNYSISVELTSSENKHPRCEHLPKIRRTLEWKVWDGSESYEGATAEEVLALVKTSRTPKPKEVTPEAIKAVDPEKIEAEL